MFLVRRAVSSASVARAASPRGRNQLPTMSPAPTTSTAARPKNTIVPELIAGPESPRAFCGRSPTIVAATAPTGTVGPFVVADAGSCDSDVKVFQELDDGPAIVLWKRIEVPLVSGVPVAGKFCIEYPRLLSGCEDGFRGVGLNAQFDGIVLACAQLELLGPLCRWRQQVVDRRHRSVVQERASGPDADQRFGAIDGAILRVLVLEAVIAHGRAERRLEQSPLANLALLELRDLLVGVAAVLVRLLRS